MQTESSDAPHPKKTTLESVMTPAIRAGAIMFGSGAEIDKVQRAITSMISGSGAEDLHILVAHNALMASITRDNKILTQVHRIDGHGVDFNKVAAVYQLAREVHSGACDPEDLHDRVEAIQSKGPLYSKSVVAGAVAAACGAFAVIFGGGPMAFLATAVAAFIGAHVRFLLASMRYNVVLIFAASAFAATLAATFLSSLTVHGDIVQTASVLYLIPGVPLIDSFEELIRGYLTVGLTRGVMGLIMVMALTMGMVLALSLRGLF
ncbi:MAG: threonine/serine exporter family protein [Desulfovibrionaceae bacterium]|jgi:uncharacterized membrane protein YjjP (DUF1212 family)